jgi:putative sigma-54 modulation protein
MRINIKATGIELTPAITEYTEKKISSIEKYFQASEAAVVQVEVGKSTQHHKHGNVFRAEVHVIGGGLDLYAASEQADLYAAIDAVRDEIVHKLTHEKGKRFALARRGGQKIKDIMKGLNFFKKRG